MVTQSSHIARLPAAIERYYFSSVARFVDGFVHPKILAGHQEDLRRARVLIACCWGTVIWTAICIGVGFHLLGLGATTIAFAIGGLLVSTNPLIQARLDSPYYPSLLYTFEVLGTLAFIATRNGGFSVPVLLWQMPVPSLATFLLDINVGFACAGLITVEALVLYLTGRAGYAFPQPFSAPQIEWLTLVSFIELVFVSAFITWVYEHTRRRAVSKQFDTAARYEYLIRNSSDLITLCNPDGTIVYVSPSVERLLGYKWDEVVGQNIFGMMHPDDREVTAERLRPLIDHPDQALVSEYRLRHRDGSWRMVQTNARNAVNEKAVSGIVANSRDVTETYELNRSLIEEKERAETANRAKSEFLANMSHELRTPLHGILSFAGFGIKRIGNVPPEKLRDYFNKIEQSGRVLLALLNDLLDLAKLEAGKTNFAFQPVDLNVLLATLIDEFSSLTSERRLSINYAVPGFETVLMIDPVRIMQVLRNLLSNAVKFSPANTTITVAIEREESKLMVAVSDQGIGVPESELDSIFDKFVQSSKTTSGAGGTGLGLAICREIVAAHEGRIWARNRQEGGAQFLLELPVKRAKELRLESTEATPIHPTEKYRRKFEQRERALRAVLGRDGAEI